MDDPARLLNQAWWLDRTAEAIRWGIIQDGVYKATLFQADGFEEAARLLRTAATGSERPRWVDQQTTDDCWPACLASLTDLPLEGFPTPPPDAPGDVEAELEYERAVRAHLVENGWLERSTGTAVPRGYAIATGPSSRREGVAHCVVVKDGKIVHDPNPSRAGLERMDHFDIVVPLAPTEGEGGEDD